MKKFIILATARTGSNMLKTSLKKHSQVYCRGECFKHLKDRGTTLEEQLMKTFIVPVDKKIKTRGCKIFYYHNKKTDLEKPPAKDNVLWNYLKDDNFSVIHLKRKNKVRLFISSQLAKDFGYIAKNKDELTKREEKPREYNPNRIINWCNKRYKMEDWGDEWFKDNPKIEVFYSDLVNNWDETMDKIQNFLGVKREDVKPETLKQNKEPLSFLIKNYDEVKEKLKSTKLEKCL